MQMKLNLFYALHSVRKGCKYSQIMIERISSLNWIKAIFNNCLRIILNVGVFCNQIKIANSFCRKPCPTVHCRTFAKFQFIGICVVVIYLYDIVKYSSAARLLVCVVDVLYCYDAIKPANLYQYVNICVHYMKLYVC